MFLQGILNKTRRRKGVLEVVDTGLDFLQSGLLLFVPIVFVCSLYVYDCFLRSDTTVG